MPDETSEPTVAHELRRFLGIPPRREGPGTARRIGQSRGMVASAARLRIGSKAAASVLSRRAEWQALCWDSYDTVGEVKYGTNFLGNALSKVGLYVGMRPEGQDVDALPVPDPDDEDAAEALEELGLTADIARVVRDNFDRLAAGSDGHGELLRKLAINFTVPGECYLVGMETLPDGATDDRIDPEGPTDESWQILSIDEIGVDQSGHKLELYDAPGGRSTRTLDVDEDGQVTNDPSVVGLFVTRIWQSHPRFRLLPDSPLRGVLSSIEELLLAEQATRAAFRTRMNAGLLLVPEGMSFGGLDDTDSGEEDDADDPFDAALAAILIEPVDDEEAGASLVPGVLRGKSEHLKEVRHLTFDRKIDDHIDVRTERGLKRLAQGMNVPVEIVTGLGDANHWTGWLIRDETFTAHVEPLALQICQALTTGWLWPILEAAGVEDPDRFVVWYDPAAAIVRPNQTANANDAMVHGAIKAETYRRALGFSEDDAPDLQDPAVETALRLIAGAPSLVQTPGLPALVDQLRAVIGGGDAAPESDVEVVVPDDEGTIPATDAVAASAVTRTVAAILAAAGSQDRILPGLGSRLTEIDRQLRFRVQAAADQSLERVASRVGANLRSRAGRDAAIADTISGTDNANVAEVLGPRLAASLGVEVGDLIAGQFDSVGALFERLGRQAHAAVLAVIPDLDATGKSVLADQQTRDLADARTWLEQELERFAAERIFARAGDVLEGEYDGVSAVPFGIIREATARAGGAAAVTAAMPSRAAISVGIATGPLATAALQDAGVQVEGWQWVYGPYPRETGFRPHQQLDGIRFQNFDDPRLANNEGWPSDSHFTPGDHPGCVCDVVPVLFDAGSVPTLDVPFDVVGATPPGGPNRGPAAKAWFDQIDETAAARVDLTRHGGGGYTTADGRWYIHRAGESWQVDLQTRHPDGTITSDLAALVPGIQAARTFIALA